MRNILVIGWHPEGKKPGSSLVKGLLNCDKPKNIRVFFLYEDLNSYTSFTRGGSLIAYTNDVENIPLKTAIIDRDIFLILNL